METPVENDAEGPEPSEAGMSETNAFAGTTETSARCKRVPVLSAVLHFCEERLPMGRCLL